MKMTSSGCLLNLNTKCGGEERVVVVVVVVSRAHQSHGWTGPSNSSLVKVLGHNEPRDSDSVSHHPLHPLTTTGSLLGQFQYAGERISRQDAGRRMQTREIQSWTQN